MGSDQFGYILDLKAKEGIVPKLDQFQVIRVLGEGGFGQVIEVVKRDCGVRYAMKVMQKEAMKQALGVAAHKRTAEWSRPQLLVAHWEASGGPLAAPRVSAAV